MNNTMIPEHKVENFVEEVSICELLTSNKQSDRKLGITSLQEWFRKAGRKQITDESGFCHIWNGLFTYYWMSDEPLNQEKPIEVISGIIHYIKNFECAMLYVRGFFNSLAKQWHQVNYSKIDEFLMFVGRFLRETLILLKNNKWDLDKVNALKRELYLAFQIIPFSSVLHLCEIFNEEVAKVSSGKIPPDALFVLLKCFVKCIVNLSPSMRVVNCINDKVFTGLAKQLKLSIKQKINENVSMKNSDHVETTNGNPKPVCIDFDGNLLLSLIERYCSKQIIPLTAKNILTRIKSMFENIEKLRKLAYNIPEEEERRMKKKIEKSSGITKVHKVKRKSNWIITGNNMKSDFKKIRLSPVKSDWIVEQVQQSKHDENECMNENMPTINSGTSKWKIEHVSEQKSEKKNLLESKPDNVYNEVHKNNLTQEKEKVGSFLEKSDDAEPIKSLKKLECIEKKESIAFQEKNESCGHEEVLIVDNLLATNDADERSEQVEKMSFCDVFNDFLKSNHCSEMNESCGFKETDFNMSTNNDAERILCLKELTKVEKVESISEFNNIFHNFLKNRASMKCNEICNYEKTNSPNDIEAKDDVKVVKSVEKLEQVEKSESFSSFIDAFHNFLKSRTSIKIDKNCAHEEVCLSNDTSKINRTVLDFVENKNGEGAEKSSKKVSKNHKTKFIKVLENTKEINSKKQFTDEFNISIPTLPLEIIQANEITSPDSICTSQSKLEISKISESPMDASSLQKCRRNLCSELLDTKDSDIMEISEYDKINSPKSPRAVERILTPLLLENEDSVISFKMGPDVISKPIEAEKIVTTPMLLRSKVKRSRRTDNGAFINKKTPVISGGKMVHFDNGKKRVKFRLEENKYQDFEEYKLTLLCNTKNPHEISKEPNKSILKSCIAIGPINPFYFPHGARKL